jgi:GrpB-like predicted nucleotidyltransferase (UPF0157 family)
VKTSEIVEYDPGWPVIDMLVAVPSIEQAERYAAVLVGHGYEETDRHYRELWPERIVLVRREGGGSRLIAFRDYLRRHPDVAAEYARVKRSLARALGHDRHAYTTAKGECIARVRNVAMAESGNVR